MDSQEQPLGATPVAPTTPTLEPTTTPAEAPVAPEQAPAVDEPSAVVAMPEEETEITVVVPEASKAPLSDADRAKFDELLAEEEAPAQGPAPIQAANPAPAAPETTATPEPVAAPAPAAQPVATEAPAPTPAEPAPVAQAQAAQTPATPATAQTPEAPAVPAAPETPSTTPNPAPAPTPTASPNPAPVAASAQTPAPATAEQAPVTAPVQTPSEPVKKSKKPFILVGIIIAVILAIAGGAVAVFAIVNNNPEKVALDAMTKLIGSKSLGVSGTVAYSLTSSDISGYDTIRLDLNAEHNALPTSAATTVTLQGEEVTDVAFSAKEVFLSDGVLYLNIDGLEDAYKSLKSAMVGEYADLIEGTAQGDFLNSVAEFTAEVDETWWKISIDDVFELPGTVLKVYEKEIRGVYDCTVSALDSVANNVSTYADIYKNNAFAKIEASDTKISGYKDSVYLLTFDTDKLAGFTNAFIASTPLQTYKTCVSDYGLTNVEHTYTASDFSGINDVKIYLGINGSHELGAVYFNYAGTYNTAMLNLKLDYAEKTVSAPSNAKSIKALADGINNLVDEYNRILNGDAIDGEVADQESETTSSETEASLKPDSQEQMAS